jgi:hypothetical protein
MAIQQWFPIGVPFLGLLYASSSSRRSRFGAVIR